MLDAGAITNRARNSKCAMHNVSRIEGFHDAVRTPYALRPGHHVGFFLEQQNML